MNKQTEEILRIFPLTIYKTKIGLTDQERDLLIKEVYIQESKSKNLQYKNLNTAWTGDTQGHEFLFSNKKFEKLFRLIALNIKKYTKLLGINNDQIDFFYQRAWATISKSGENIQLHRHRQSHLSFAYYLKKNKNDGSLNFHNKALHNEIAPALFDLTNEKSKNFFKPIYDNANVMVTHPEADEIYIFPSKTPHSTSSNKTDEQRISVSADISIFAKNAENVEQLITPINKWLKF
jgi:uncharacterized protein (TIGR02466 family)|tara:strand:- start:117 stop:821 length:705 start_codon:yes stop_codon:yes gene_type:complete